VGRGRAQAGSGPERGSGYVPAPVLTQRGCVCVWWEWNEASSCQANAAEVHAYAADHPEFGQAWSHRVEFTANEANVRAFGGKGASRPPGRSMPPTCKATWADQPGFGQSRSHRVECTANEANVCAFGGMEASRPPGRSMPPTCKATWADQPEFGQSRSHRVEFTANEGYVIGSDGMGTGRPPGRSNAADLDGYLGGICSHQTGQSDDLVGMDRP
jgi:hypothetical protein